MRLDAAEMDHDKPASAAHFTAFKVDRRTRQARLAHQVLAAFIEDVGGLSHLTASERLALEDAAIEVARARTLQERFAAGQAVSCDVTAAAHLARKGRSLVARIAKRLGARRRTGR